MDDFSKDEIFGTLGGSLMKDLLADLQVDDGDFSLDQLEKELATLDQDPPHFQQQPLPALDAASLVVSHARDQATSVPGLAPPQTDQGVDAWSLSLQNFTAMSLQDDFLAADSARKKQQHTAPTLQPGMLEGAEEYDIAEKVNVVAPPGMAAMSGVPEAPPLPKAFPRTPENSMNIVGDVPTGSIPSQAPPADPETVPLSAIPSQQQKQEGNVQEPQNVVPIPKQSAWQNAPQAVPPQMMPMMPQGVPPPQQGASLQMMPPQGPPPQGVPPQAQEARSAPVSTMPPPVGGAAWQTPVVPIPQPARVYCNPHPAAPPIPASALETPSMNASNIAYVVHSILKPVLALGISEDDYYVQFVRRLGGQANSSIPKKVVDTNEEMISRTTKSKEWSSDKGTLGYTAKANVARPRALIATPVISSSEQDMEQKQRATLWKARIYCDQAYQAYQAVVDIWRMAPPGSVPPQVQTHLVKLMKCMGVTNVDKKYKLDRDSMALLGKLGKGRTLISRALEQALLPPNAVQALLPVLLDVLLELVQKKTNQESAEDVSFERLFRAITSVLQNLNTSSETLLQCLGCVQKTGKVSLGSPARMECAHTLLQKGSMVAGQDPSEETRAAWGRAEGEFMSLLQAF